STCARGIKMARPRRQAPADGTATQARLAHRASGSSPFPGGPIETSAMKQQMFNTTVLFYPNKKPKLRLFALWYFTILMFIWNVLGHTVLGFEQSWATPLAAVGTAIIMQMFLEWVDAKAKDRELRFAGGLANFLNFLPAALIPGFACGMLLY